MLGPSETRGCCREGRSDRRDRGRGDPGLDRGRVARRWRSRDGRLCHAAHRWLLPDRHRPPGHGHLRGDVGPRRPAERTGRRRLAHRSRGARFGPLDGRSGAIRDAGLRRHREDRRRGDLPRRREPRRDPRLRAVAGPGPVPPRAGRVHADAAGRAVVLGRPGDGRAAEPDDVGGRERRLDGRVDERRRQSRRRRRRPPRHQGGLVAAGPDRHPGARPRAAGGRHRAHHPRQPRPGSAGRAVRRAGGGVAGAGDRHADRRAGRGGAGSSRTRWC